MDPWHQIKEEFVESGSISFSGNAPADFPAPQPLECLHEGGPPPFLNKTYEMVDDPESNEIVSWYRGGQSFVVWDPNAFSTNLLPRFFKHSNFSSFVRQLNTYGFRKIDPDKWEFANEGFLRGQKHLLKNIRRRRTSSSSHQSLPLQQGSLEPSVEDGIYGVEEEVGRLKRDKQVLLAELVKIKQQQQTTRTYLKSMENRLQNAESKQQQMMNFLAKAIKNPGFLQQLSQQNGRRKALEELLSKKRNRYIDSSSSSSSVGRFRTDGVNGMMNHVKDEPSISDYGGGYQVSELEALAFEMQGFGRPGKEVRDDADHGVEEEEGCRIRELDDEFWNELFTEEMSDNSGGSQRSI